jgi:hypothetical protein
VSESPYEERLKALIEQEEAIAKGLIEKAQQMLMYPLARTTRTETEDGKTLITEINPAKWSMSDATRFYEQANKLLDRVTELRLQASQPPGPLNKLPHWAPTYIAAWGSHDESGTRMSVTRAAELAGTTASNVRMLRSKEPQFARMEYIARHGDGEVVTSLIEAGLRGNAAVIFDAFMRLVRSGDRQAILNAMNWLQDKPSYLVMMTDDELLAKYHETLEALRGTVAGDGAQGPVGSEGDDPEAEGTDLPAGMDDDVQDHPG